MAKTDAALLATLLSETLAILPRGYPSKPSPIHIANNLIVRALGAGELHQALAGLVRERIHEDVLWDVSPARDASSTQELLKAVFNSDGNVFHSTKPSGRVSFFSSPFPLMRDFAGNDSSDDGYASALWKALGDANRERLAAALARLETVESIEDLDPASRLAFVVAKSLRGAGASVATSPRTGASAVGGTEFGRRVGEALSDALERQVGSDHLGQRVEVVRRLSLMLSFSVILGMLYDACRAADPQGPADPANVLGLLVFTGITPGTSTDPLVRMSSASLQETLLRARSGVVASADAVLSEPVPGARTWAQTAAGIATTRAAGNDAVALSDALQAFRRKPTAQVLVDEWLPLDHLRLAVRSLGYKTGCVAPQRNGAPRFALETSFLTALVSYLTPEEDVPLQSFVDDVYETFGLLVGEPSDLRPTAFMRLEASAGRMLDPEDVLLEATGRLTERLLHAGLARRYSDGLVIVGAP